MKRSVTFFVFVMAFIGFTTLAYDVALDGAETQFSGFPLPWYSQLPAASLATEIYWVPLIIDVLFLFVLSRYVFRLIDSYESAHARLWKGVAVAIVVFDTAVAGAPLIFHDLFVQAWPSSNEFRITDLRVGL